MRWNKLKNIAFDHPYFEYKGHLLSEAEAERILCAGYIGVDEFMEKVRVHCGQQEVAPVHERTRMPRRMRKRHNARSHLVRRLTVACIMLLTVFIFMTFTEPGIALANSIRTFIVRIFDGSLIAQSVEPPGELPPIEYENIPETFSSLEEAAITIGRPVVDASSHGTATILSIVPHIHDDGGIDIQCTFRMPSGETYYVVQYFYSNDVDWGSYGSVRDDDTIETFLSNGTTMYIGIHDDGTAFGESFDAGTRISILSIELTPQELLNIASEIYFIMPE